MDVHDPPPLDKGEGMETKYEVAQVQANTIDDIMTFSDNNASSQNITLNTTPIRKDVIGTITPSPPQGKNYKFLYKEVTKRLFEQTERCRELDLVYNQLKKNMFVLQRRPIIE